MHCAYKKTLSSHKRLPSCMLPYACDIWRLQLPQLQKTLIVEKSVLQYKEPHAAATAAEPQHMHKETPNGLQPKNTPHIMENPNVQTTPNTCGECV
jgi:hypothetical protein